MRSTPAIVAIGFALALPLIAQGPPSWPEELDAVRDAPDSHKVLFGLLRVPHGPNPKIERISLPSDGSLWVEADSRVPGILVRMTAWARGSQIYFYDSSTRQLINTKLQPVGPHDNPDNIESVEVKAKSHDGALVPLSIIYPKGMQMHGLNPTLLEGYGRYGISYPAYFDSTRLAWHEKGGVYAVCHVRGGGEYGEEWHLAGKDLKKPNTWKDFIACAQ